MKHYLATVSAYAPFPVSTQMTIAGSSYATAAQRAVRMAMKDGKLVPKRKRIDHSQGMTIKLCLISNGDIPVPQKVQ